ncbi:MAG TPA: rod shape-determining protein [Desulfovibrio sp.]|jgi:rod shape-determining protein MreB|uniref:rod shape-determining protein n=1 Tax=Desulfovibrio TaxID=872 RepID=UPI0004245879|nr:MULTISPECIES: rod shape-determining protein [Desulfovibrio]MDY0305849.1 rod shape-determining protein [Desulfovibrionaceae bacterium]HMM38599.1 rod shape-determining protein [Desulfovibrio sp.]
MFFRRLWNFLGGRNLAMDLGTANSLLYCPGEGIVLNEPSVVALDRITGEVIAVGAEAKRYLGRTPERVQVIRPMRDGVIADFDTTSQMISSFIAKASRGLKLLRPKLIICVPLGITPVEKRAVIEAGQRGGARDVRLIEEPLAVAIGAGLPFDQPLGNMVLDIGGGTAEVAVVSLSAIAHAESIRVAGDEMNEAIQRYFQNEFQMQIGENMAEQVKITLGSAVELPEPLSMEVLGKNLVEGAPRSVLASDSHVREAIREPLNAIMQAVRNALEKTPPELAADIADSGLLLAGGGSLLRGLDVLIKRETGLNAVLDADPLTTVARGTGRVLEKGKAYEGALLE